MSTWYRECGDHELIRQLDEHGVGLTAWEIGFVESMLDALEEAGELTPGQRSKAEQIAEQRVPHDEGSDFDAVV